MTDKEFKKLKRSDLISIIYEYQKRQEELLAEIDSMRTELEEKRIKISNAGSVAEAVVGLNRLFETAQQTADDYLVLQAMRDYGLDSISAKRMAAAVSEYYQINGVRKAEFYSKAWFGNTPRGFSPYEWGDEALRWIERSNENVALMNIKI